MKRSSSPYRDVPALLAVVIVALASACGSAGPEPDSATPGPPRLTRLAVTPVPFPLATLTTMDAIVSTLRDLRLRLETQIGEDQATMYTTSIKLEEAPGGAGYVQKVSGDTLELIVYPTGQTLRLDNASSADIKLAPPPGDPRGFTRINVNELKPLQLVTFLSPPWTGTIVIRAFNGMWQ